MGHRGQRTERRRSTEPRFQNPESRIQRSKHRAQSLASTIQKSRAKATKVQSSKTPEVKNPKPIKSPASRGICTGTCHKPLPYIVSIHYAVYTYSLSEDVAVSLGRLLGLCAGMAFEIRYVF